jgi:hypothetical protein
MHASGSFPIRFRRLQLQAHMNAPDNEHVILEFDLALRFGHEAFVGCIDLTRLQRAPKGSCKSACRRRDNIIKRGGVRLKHCRGHLVVQGHCAVDAKGHGFRFRRKPCAPHWSFYPLDSDLGTIDNLRHHAPD